MLNMYVKFHNIKTSIICKFFVNEDCSINTSIGKVSGLDLNIRKFILLLLLYIHIIVGL